MDKNMKNFFIKLIMAFSYVGVQVSIFIVQINDQRFHLFLENIAYKHKMNVNQIVMLTIALLIIFNFIVLAVQNSIYQTILKLFGQSEKSISKIFASIVFSSLLTGLIFIICTLLLKISLFSASFSFSLMSTVCLLLLFYAQTKDRKALLVVSAISFVFFILNAICGCSM
ncbi:MAG: hypothetical protein LBF82_02885 [Lactobacillales bacterium]|nr:hypothetical protein [Lactobacillales bacterium]